MPEKLKLRNPDIESRKRALNPESRKLMPHSVSRHVDFDTKLISGSGNDFGQGTLFPRHVKPGVVTKIQREVINEYYKYKQGTESRVILIKEAGGAYRITLELRRFGVEKVGAFVRRGQICTVFPEEETA